MRQTTILKIIKNDYFAFLLAIGGPIALGIATFTAVYGFIPSYRSGGHRDVDHSFVIGMYVVSGILTVLLLYLLWRRVSRIRRIAADGVLARARVREIWFFRDRGRIEIEYTHNGTQHRTGAAIMKNRETESISAGDEVTIALDPLDPRAAIVVQLYCEKLTQRQEGTNG